MEKQPPFVDIKSFLHARSKFFLAEGLPMGEFVTCVLDPSASQKIGDLDRGSQELNKLNLFFYDPKNGETYIRQDNRKQWHVRLGKEPKSDILAEVLHGFFSSTVHKQNFISTYFPLEDNPREETVHNILTIAKGLWHSLNPDSTTTYFTFFSSNDSLSGILKGVDSVPNLNIAAYRLNNVHTGIWRDPYAIFNQNPKPPKRF